MDILQAIGNTSLVRLRRVVPKDGADVFVKLERGNPAGSMKDGMAGRLRPEVPEHRDVQGQMNTAVFC
jgi:cysteine synthase